MKKILFVIQEFTQGGINRCLENLLPYMDSTKYEIFVYSLYEDGGDYYKRIFASRIISKSNLYYFLHDNRYIRKFIGLYNRLTRRYNWGFLYKREAQYLQRKYDLDVIIAYHEGMTVEFVSYFRDVKRITWFHCDPLVLGKSLFEEYKEYYKKIDTIVCVSNVVRDSIRNMFAEFTGNLEVVHNTLDIDSIRKNAFAPISDYGKRNSVFRILSVGRSSKVKQFEKIPGIMRQLLNKGVNNVIWSIIVSGTECNEEIENAICDNNVKDYVFMLGEKDNPYPYIFQSDLLVSTSYSEAYPTVINEAQTLGVPVVANNYPSAKEIVDERCGFVCSIGEMPKLLYNLVTDKNGDYSNVKHGVSMFDYDNAGIVCQLDGVFN
ncbi:glycosyltransferase [uncultured Bacteroides sp.]|jgi:glycosyltransferase involved in cell wall biosynthesis|uniref:glycosyltransferase n=1 Tax=uncultured Bacteroides sp. TaxID=162156 RepID=UPI0025881CFE|nr:glycosyltransferase [uncultured Bacteroides sp.]